MVSDAITRLVRAIAPGESLQANDPRYVNCDDVRGASLVDDYVRALRRADPACPQVKLFAGHRGIGKTCELNRLKGILESPCSSKSPQPAFRVIYMDVRRDVALNGLDWPDLLVFMVARIRLGLSKAGIPGIGPANPPLIDAWNALKKVLKPHIRVDHATVETGFDILVAELRNQDQLRPILRQLIQCHSTQLVAGVNAFLQEAVQQLRQHRTDIVMIVDGLERLPLRALGGDELNTHSRLFFDRIEQLTSFCAHTIYSVPISLLYDRRYAELEQTLGEHHAPMPMIRLHEIDDERGSLTSAGLDRLWAIIEARCVYANVDIADLFDSRSTGQYLCEMSGGHPRNLLMFLHSALNNTDTLPVTRQASEYAVRIYANSLFRQIPEDYWDILRRFASPRTNIAKDEMHRQMLLLLHIFEYVNDSPWYEINPAIRTLPPLWSSN
jgi:hypothetical protein